MTERELHKQIRKLLDLKRIVYFESRMDKKTTQCKGTPDFILAVWLKRGDKLDPTQLIAMPVPCAWECKIGDAKLTPEQEEMFRRLQKPPNAWRVRVIRSFEEARDELKSLGI